MLARARPESPKKKPPMRDLGDGTALFAQHVTLASTDRLAEDVAERGAHRVHHRVHVHLHPALEHELLRLRADVDQRGRRRPE